MGLRVGNPNWAYGVTVQQYGVRRDYRVLGPGFRGRACKL